MRLSIRLAAALGLLVAILLVWGVAIEPRFILDEREEVGEVPHLPRAWQGREIALFADLQIGMWLANEGAIEKAVRRIVARSPAAVLIAGDFLYTPTDEELSDFMEDREEGEFDGPVREKIERVLALLEPLTRSGIPTYAVLGNHDFAMNRQSSRKLGWVARRLTQALQRAGVVVLHNEAVAMSEPGPQSKPGTRPEHAGENSEPKLYLGGVGPIYPKEASVEATLAAIPAGAPRVILMHNPQAYAGFPAGAAPLALAAHTHGGQMRIPGLPDWSWMQIVQRGELHADGWVAQSFGKPGNRLYVNRGIGFSTLPIRINCPPEVTYFRLMAASEPRRTQ